MPATESETGEKGAVMEDAQSVSEGDVSATPDPRTAGKGKASAVEVVDDDDSGQESNDDEQEEDEYAIEKILKHRMAKDGTTEYLIRWEGYESSDDTWEPEGNCNAPELVASYWKDVPTIKQPRKMQEVQKKLAKVKSPRKPAPASPTKRALAVSDDDDNNDETGVNDTEADEVAKELEGGGRGSSKRRKASSSQGDKSNEGKGGSGHAKDADADANGDFDEEARLAQIEAELKLLKKWNKMPDWEDSIEDVETMDRADDLVLRARLCFKNGDRFWVEKDVAYEKCPRAMLKFYEERLRFRTPNEPDGANPM